MPTASWARTPVCNVHWAGFKSNTYELQSCGWDAAVEKRMNYGAMQDEFVLMLKHREHGWEMFGLARDRFASFMAARDPYSYNSAPPEFEICSCQPSGGHRAVTLSLPRGARMQHVDMTPVALEDNPFRGIFPPWEPAHREIIIAPDTVASLMEKISKLHEPELQSIRERNRARELREVSSETRHATIVSLAA